MKNQPLRSGHLIAACSLAALLIAVSIVCFTPSLAQQGKKKSDQKPEQEQAGTTTSRGNGFMYADSSGNRHEYGSYDDLPARQQAEIKAVFKDGIRFMNAKLAQLEAMQPYGDTTGEIDVDSITEAAMKTATVALEHVDWEEIGSKVDSAMRKVIVVEGPRLSREIRAGLAAAQKKLSDPKVNVQIRREIAGARRELAMATNGHKRVENQRILEQAGQELELAEIRMEHARLEMAQAREDLKRLRRENPGAPAYRVRIIPTPSPAPAPAFGIDIPAAPAPPASTRTPAPSDVPQAPAAPPAGPSRRSAPEAPQRAR